MSSQNIIKPDPEVIWTQVGDEVILLTMNDASPQYIGLRGTGTRIWQLIEEKIFTEEEICGRLLNEFEVDEATVRADVSSTLEGLRIRGLTVTA